MKTIKDLDILLKEMTTDLKSLDGSFSGAGWDSSIHPETLDSGSPISFAAMAYIHEYGTGDIPARRLFFITLREIETKGHNDIKRIILTNLLKHGRINKKLLLKELADYVKNELQRIMGDPLYLIDNAQSTIDRKGGNTPLVDTGALRDNIITVIGD